MTCWNDCRLNLMLLETRFITFPQLKQSFTEFLVGPVQIVVIKPKCLFCLKSQEDRNSVDTLWLDATVPYTISKDLGRSWFLHVWPPECTRHNSSYIFTPNSWSRVGHLRGLRDDLKFHVHSLQTTHHRVQLREVPERQRVREFDISVKGKIKTEINFANFTPFSFFLPGCDCC